jgi:hypothetical protein
MTKRRKGSGSHPTNFLVKTYEILCDGSMSDIIAWSEDGSSFLIKDVTEFSQKILPKYFKHSNFQSFVRQLNMYDFHKCKNGEENSFYHNMFQRGKKHLLKEIHRKTSALHNPPLSRSLSRSETKDLFEKIKKMKQHQEGMEAHIKKLEDMYADLLKNNQLLFSQLQQSREKEKRSEANLQLLAGSVKNLNRGEIFTPRVGYPYTNKLSIIDVSPKLKMTGVIEPGFLLSEYCPSRDNDMCRDSPVPISMTPYDGFPLDDADIDFFSKKC